MSVCHGCGEPVDLHVGTLLIATDREAEDMGLTHWVIPVVIPRGEAEVRRLLAKAVPPAPVDGLRVATREEQRQSLLASVRKAQEENR